MKTVKICKDCGKYNNYKLYECAFCGANLNDDTVEVNDDEFEVKSENKIEKEDTISVKSENSSVKSKVCPVCGYETVNAWCDNCGNYLEELSENNLSSERKVTLKYKENTYSFNVGTSVLTIGRNDFSNINSEDVISISRKHIEIYFRDNKLYIKDISSFGTYLNGEKMVKDKEYEVINHSVIKFVFFEMECSY